MEEKQKFWELMFKFAEAMRNTHHRTEPNLKPPPISISQLKIMGCIVFNNGRPVKVKDIAQELGITPGAVSQQVDVLVKDGVLERTTREDDRRAVDITLSPNGREIKQKMDHFFGQLAEKLVVNIPRQKQEIFMEVLEMMMKELEKIKKSGDRI